MIQIILAISYVAISIYLHYQTYKLYRKEQLKNERIVMYIDSEIIKADNQEERPRRFKRKALRDIKRKINEIRL